MNFPAILRAARVTRPTLSVAAARTFLEQDEDGILPLIETGALVAWDIRSPKAKSRELRILVASLIEFLAVSVRGQAGYRCNVTPEAAVAYVIDEMDRRHLEPRPWFSGGEIRRALNCSSTHVLDLVKSKELKLLARTDWRRGPNGSPCIERGSFESFLRRRFA